MFIKAGDVPAYGLTRPITNEQEVRLEKGGIGIHPTFFFIDLLHKAALNS